MTNPQNAQSPPQEKQEAGNLEESSVTEPTIIAEQHRSATSGPNVVPADAAATSPSVQPELPDNADPTQQPHIPADPMDPDDPNSPNVIEGDRQKRFPQDPPGERPPNE